MLRELPSFLLLLVRSQLHHILHRVLTQGNDSFISDIASFELKPLFLVGASMTAVGFLFTVAAVHVMRYEPGFALIRCPVVSDEDTASEHGSADHQNAHNHITGDDEEEEDHETTKTLKVISLLSIFASGMASTALILLGVMDTFRYKFAHHIFLRICFGGLALQSAGTAIVYSNEVLCFVSYLYHWGVWHNDWGKRSLRVRVLYVTFPLFYPPLFLVIPTLTLQIVHLSPLP